MRNNWRDYVKKFNQNDEELIIQMFSNEEAEEWMSREVPCFECSDKTIEEIYYFRWWLFRKHIKKTEEGRIITEFLADVPWSGAYNSINCAGSHHLSEARWMKKDRELSREYIDFWFRGSGDEYSYSSWMIHTVYEMAVVMDDRNMAVRYLDDFIRFYQRIESTNFTPYGLFWSDDDRDAMERSISGKGLRPTLNSYMYANALAIAKIAEWAGQSQIKEIFQIKAEKLKYKILSMLWDKKDQFFKVIPLDTKDSRLISADFADISEEHNVREAIGYIPWDMGVPDTSYDEAWRFLMDEEYFRTPFGPSTAEKKHKDYMKPADHECMWNGPVWPFATTQILNSMIRILQNEGSKNVDKSDFMALMRTYAGIHYRIREDGKKVNWLDENVDPDTGEWLSRKILSEWKWREDKGGYERGKDYNHSAFCDLVIRGICGVKITEENNLVIHSLLPWGMWDYFMLEDLPYKNHRITIAFDKDGSRYKKGKGMWVAVDGEKKVSIDKPAVLSLILS